MDISKFDRQSVSEWVARDTLGKLAACNPDLAPYYNDIRFHYPYYNEMYPDLYSSIANKSLTTSSVIKFSPPHLNLTSANSNVLVSHNIIYGSAV